MSYVYLKAAIECDNAKAISRDFKLSGLVQLENVGNCRKYNCKRNSESKILKELNPKEPRHCKTSYLNINDEIRAEDIVMFVKTAKALTFEVSNYTASHKVQHTETNCYTYAEITRPFPNLGVIKDAIQTTPFPKALYNE